MFADWVPFRPAGWNVVALREALNKGEPLPIQPVERPGWEKPLRARPVPNPAARPEFLAHPRLRRTSPITHYVVAAALEAVAGLRAKRTAEAGNSALSSASNPAACITPAGSLMKS